MRASSLPAIALLTMLVGCAQILGIEDTTLDESFNSPNTPDGVAAPEWASLSCPLLAVYVAEWELNSLQSGVSLQRFLVLINQSDFPVDISNLAFISVGDTHGIVDVEAAIEPWIDSDFFLSPGEQLGALSDTAEQALWTLLAEPANDTGNVARIDLLDWENVGELWVSAELQLATTTQTLPLQMRFQPGDETRPLLGRYTCAE